MCNATAFENWVNRQDRRDVELKAVASRADGASMTVTLRNLSYEGCLLTAETVFEIGEKVRIVIPRMGAIKAEFDGHCRG
jgi:hypothetical protein